MREPVPSAPLRPVVRFLCHGAERSGPPIYLLRLFEHWASHSAGFDVELIVARPGELVDQFRRIAPTKVARLDRSSPERVAGRALSKIGLGSVGVGCVAAATRWRVGSSIASASRSITVVNGATAPTTELLRILDDGGRVALIAHELSTGWFGNLDASDRELLLSRVGSYLAVSSAVAAFLEHRLGVDAAAITIVPPPVPTPDPVPDHGRPERRTVGGGGVTDWRKSPESWLRIAHRVARTDGDVQFVWFGGAQPGTPEFWPIEHEIEHLSLTERVTFTGPVDSSTATLEQCTLFVTTAKEDAAPLVCAEAAALGVPVVAYGGGGAAELIEAAQCGIVVDYPDEDAMADGIVALLGDPDRRAVMGDHGRRYTSATRSTPVVAAQVAEWALGTMS